jgi:hypothetical protein
MCKSSVLILPQFLARNYETIYSAGPYRHQWGTWHRPIQTLVGHKAQAVTDTSGAQGTGPCRHQWGTRHRPIQTPVGHKAQAHTDTSRAHGMTNAELKVRSS